MISPLMCDRIYLYADRQRSKRYKQKDLIAFLNIAQDSVMKDRYDNIKKATGYSFELVERVRGELYTLVKNSPAIPIVGANNIQPPDFNFEVLMQVVINGKKVLSRSRTFEESDLGDNVYTRPDDDEPIHRKTATSFMHEWGGGIITSADLWYLRQPRDIAWSEVNLVSGTILAVGVSYYVNAGSVVYAAQTYQTGSVIIPVTPGLAISGAGTVNVIVDCELPLPLHEEIPKVAASIMMGTFENYQKSARIEQEVKRS